MDRRFIQVSHKILQDKLFDQPNTYKREKGESVSCPVMCDSVTPWTAAHQAPLSKGCSRKGYWSDLLFPSPGDLPKPGTETGSPALQEELPGKSKTTI